MALKFHDGFETGGAEAWDAVGGTPSFPSTILYAEQTTASAGPVAYGGNYIGQTFTVGSESILLHSIQIYMYKNGTPGADLEVAVQGVDGSGHPDNVDITYTTILESDVGTDYAWETATFSSPVSLSASTQYAFVCRVAGDGGNSSNYYIIGVSITDLFAGGYRKSTTDSGSSWSSVTTSDVTFKLLLPISHTGKYAMRCNSTGSAVYVGKTLTGNQYRLSFYLYIASAPTADAQLMGKHGSGWCLFLDTDRYLDVYYGITPTKKADGTTQLNTGTWYRISISTDSSENCKVYIDGNIEHSVTETGMSGGTVPTYGVFNADVTADLYFDDFAIDGTDSTDDLGDIRTLAARPNAEGTDQDTATSKADGWVDSTETAVAKYTELDTSPPSTASYNLCDNTSIFRYSVNLDNCGSGNLSGIGASDTIHAVHFMWYYETEGGGPDDYGIRIRCSDDGGSPLTNDNIDDPKDPTWYAGTDKYHADTPVGANAWTQAYVNSLEMGMAAITSGGKGIWWYEAYAMVAYTPSAVTEYQKRIIFI